MANKPLDIRIRIHIHILLLSLLLLSSLFSSLSLNYRADDWSAFFTWRHQNIRTLANISTQTCIQKGRFGALALALESNFLFGCMHYHCWNIICVMRRQDCFYFLKKDSATIFINPYQSSEWKYLSLDSLFLLLLHFNKEKDFLSFFKWRKKVANVPIDTV